MFFNNGGRRIFTYRNLAETILVAAGGRALLAHNVAW